MKTNEPYQLPLTRQPERYTDPEWRKELAARKARNANYMLTFRNFKAGK